MSSLQTLKRLRRKELFRLVSRLFRFSTYSAWWQLRRIRQRKVDPAKRVQEVVSFCHATVPHYRRVLDSLGQREHVDFTRIPLLDKSAMRQNFADLMARSRSGALHGAPKLFVVRTSGSTGWPASHLKSRGERLNNIASLTQIFEAYGAPRFGTLYDLGLHWDGQPPVQGRVFPGAFICWNFEGYSFDFPDLKQGYLDILSLDRPDIIFGTPSRIVALCKFAADHAISLRPKATFVTYEAMVGGTKAYLTDQLACPVVEIYGTAETGILGWTCPEGQLHLDDTMYYAECVRADGSSCDLGESGRLVVTSLHAATMPLLRFDTGDLARFATKRCACGSERPAIEALEGRASDWIVTPSGTRLSPYNLYGVVNGFGVSEYQIVQRADGRISLLLPPGETLTAAQLADLDAEFWDYFREAMPYEIDHSGAYLRTASGKRNAFVQERRAEDDDA